MQNIHVKRFKNPSDDQPKGTVEADDRSWVLVLDANNEPHLFVKIHFEDEGDGFTSGLVDVEQIPGSRGSVCPHCGDGIDYEELLLKEQEGLEPSDPIGPTV